MNAVTKLFAVVLLAGCTSTIKPTSIAKCIATVGLAVPNTQIGEQQVVIPILHGHPNNSGACYDDIKWRGLWELRLENGRVDTGKYVNDKKNGRWELRSPSGHLEIGPYVDGKKHGQWKVRFTDGMVATSPYVRGKMHGRREIRLPDGTMEIENYVNGVKQQ